MNSQQAILSNESNYTVFRAGDKVIRFRAPYSLEHYTAQERCHHHRRGKYLSGTD